MRVSPWFSPFLKNVYAITRCPFYSMSAIDRFDCSISSNRTKSQKFINISLHEKCPNMELFLVFIFVYSDWIRRLTVFNPNTGKYGQEKPLALSMEAALHGEPIMFCELFIISSSSFSSLELISRIAFIYNFYVISITSITFSYQKLFFHPFLFIVLYWFADASSETLFFAVVLIRREAFSWISHKQEIYRI